MRIVTWNINSVRLRINLLIKLIMEENPDIICLQETKTVDGFFPEQPLRELGFNHIIYTGEKSYNGVAIISRIPVMDSFSLEFYNQDRRHIAIKTPDFEVHNFYVPAGGDEPDPEINPKFRHKLNYIKSMEEWFLSNRSMADRLIITGDLNIAPHEHDVWSSRQLKNVVSHTDVERDLLIRFQKSLNFIDSGRYFVDSKQKLYTWWSYRNLNWQISDRGRRLDHIWVSSNMQAALAQIRILGDARSWERPSDHVPFILDLN